MEKQNKNFKKTQSETVGFVVIVLVVLIIGVIFLGISLRNKNAVVATVDAELSNFLIASSSYTTDCYKDSEPNYRSLSDLVKDCYEKDFSKITCLSGKTSCDALKETYSSMLEKFKPAGTLAYSKLRAYYLPKSEDNETAAEETAIFELAQGDSKKCAEKRAGRIQASEQEGSIFTELEICPA